MSNSTIKVRTAFACEDLRHEMDGKLFAIGIHNPVLGRPPLLEDGTSPATKLHFILSLDVPEAGDFDMRFRLRPLGGKGRGSSTKLRVQFLEAANNIPFPIGPMRMRPDADAMGFSLEQEIGDGRWKRLAEWHFGNLEDGDE
jgi:hypothetical protein